jgi:hypothetical protein
VISPEQAAYLTACEDLAACLEYCRVRPSGKSWLAMQLAAMNKRLASRELTPRGDCPHAGEG